MSPLAEVAALFLRLGFTAFGGPAAHIAIMHDEIVKRRKWLSDEQFLDLLGATNLIPGPNSTEMAIHIGYRICACRLAWSSPCRSLLYRPGGTDRSRACVALRSLWEDPTGRLAAIWHQTGCHCDHHPGTVDTGKQSAEDKQPDRHWYDCLRSLFSGSQRNCAALRRRIDFYGPFKLSAHAGVESRERGPLGQLGAGAEFPPF
jgi:hypothetical protein